MLCTACMLPSFVRASSTGVPPTSTQRICPGASAERGNAGTKAGSVTDDASERQHALADDDGLAGDSHFARALAGGDDRDVHLAGTVHEAALVAVQVRRTVVRRQQPVVHE